MQQDQLNNEALTLNTEIADLYRSSQDRERRDLLSLESLDGQLQRVQMEMRDC